MIYGLSSSKVDAAAIIIILPHYNNIIAHFLLLVKPFAHFLADVEEWINRLVCSVHRLRRLICFPRQAYKNENVFIILFKSSKTLASRWPKHYKRRARASIGFSAKIFTAHQSCGLKDINRLLHRWLHCVGFILFLGICKIFSHHRTNFLTSCESFSIILM